MRELRIEELKVKFYDVLQLEGLGKYIRTEGPKFNDTNTEFIECITNYIEDWYTFKEVLIHVEIIKGEYLITAATYIFFIEDSELVEDRSKDPATIVLIDELKKILEIDKIRVNSDTLNDNGDQITVYTDIV